MFRASQRPTGIFPLLLVRYTALHSSLAQKLSNQERASIPTSPSLLAVSIQFPLSRPELDQELMVTEGALDEVEGIICLGIMLLTVRREFKAVSSFMPRPLPNLNLVAIVLDGELHENASVPNPNHKQSNWFWAISGCLRLPIHYLRATRRVLGLGLINERTAAAGTADEKDGRTRPTCINMASIWHAPYVESEEAREPRTAHCMHNKAKGSSTNPASIAPPGRRVGTSSVFRLRSRYRYYSSVRGTDHGLWGLPLGARVRQANLLSSSL
ncbi:hypothetical protein B0T20DRAFT_465609 [Sordaria brevicollis]|uniref:Uncharacterized protein n=1 Tax=Sordaria brevicollis TaxID=83679 RepID=A0AAE0PMR7_SORBR|nr:hypothetical protein B0T20DRAFT_465609 [Sordaria brevicollis]